MVFDKHVEIGRVCMINFGEDYGRVCTIVNVINGHLALIDGPQKITGVHRQKINFKRLSLTPLKVKVPLNATQKSLVKAFEEENIMEAWNKTSLARKLEMRAKRANMTDFDRFKLMLAKKQKAKLIKKELKALRSA